MKIEENSKIKASHLSRKAFLYVRQSTIKQVYNNTESTKRQYDLRQRALDLGWPEEQIVVIDHDLGQSAASGVDREGFQRLVAEVGMGHAGIVMGLEVSRLARSCCDWHRLLEICALSQALILDEDGIYDPTHFNDRILLGLKGTMSEAELYVIRARLQGGLLNKARRGEYRKRLPVGYIYNAQGKVIFAPDQQIQGIMHLFFSTFKQVGSAQETVRTFREQKIKFPVLTHCGPDKGTVSWNYLTTSKTFHVLHNPCYAGAYAYGQSVTRIGADGKVRFKKLPPEQWDTLILDAHPGYITWQEYKENEKRLAANNLGRNRQSPPREGPALLQGIAVCGICGARMRVRYHYRRGNLNPDYVCNGMGNTLALPKCQAIPGEHIDHAIGKLLLEVVTPTAMEVALTVQEELARRVEEVDKIHRQQVERATYEMDLARRRYMQVDPDNRLVAATLEGEWNEKLQALTHAREEYERRRKEEGRTLDDEARTRIYALVSDFSQLWNNPRTPLRERKRIVRLMIEDVTLIKNEKVHVHVRFKGGATHSLTLPRLCAAWEERQTPANIVKKIDHLLDEHTYDEIAKSLNKQGLVSGCGNEFTSRKVRLIQRDFELKSRFTRLRETGLLTLDEVAAKLGISNKLVKYRYGRGKINLKRYKLSDKGDYMYENPENPEKTALSVP